MLTDLKLSVQIWSKTKKNVDVVDKYDVAKDRINNFYMKAFKEWHNHLYEVESSFVVNMRIQG